jgi:hypothetical protein
MEYVELAGIFDKQEVRRFSLYDLPDLLPGAVGGMHVTPALNLLFAG